MTIEIKAMTYEESRIEYFKRQRDAAAKKMKYWSSTKQAERLGMQEAYDRACQAGQEFSYYNDAINAFQEMSEAEKEAEAEAIEEQQNELIPLITKVVMERDALLAILKDTGDCELCKHACPPEKEDFIYDNCVGCDNESCRCRNCTTIDNHWEWRGLIEENGCTEP